MLAVDRARSNRVGHLAEVQQSRELCDEDELVARRTAVRYVSEVERSNDDLTGEQDEHIQWCRYVRDPASRLTEGKRWLRTKNGKATICYEIAQLSASKFAIRYRMEYECGDMRGVGGPWTAYSSRMNCLDSLLEAAAWHFGQEVTGMTCNQSQKTARSQMLELLNGGLFGFIEPDVETDDP